MSFPPFLKCCRISSTFFVKVFISHCRSQKTQLNGAFSLLIKMKFEFVSEFRTETYDILARKRVSIRFRI